MGSKVSSLEPERGPAVFIMETRSCVFVFLAMFGAGGGRWVNYRLVSVHDELGSGSKMAFLVLCSRLKNGPQRSQILIPGTSACYLF